MQSSARCVSSKRVLVQETSRGSWSRIVKEPLSYLEKDDSLASSPGTLPFIYFDYYCSCSCPGVIRYSGWM